MATPERTPVTPTRLVELLAVARLDLHVDRHDTVAQSISAVHQLLDGLDAVEVGETPPATSFDARWR